MNPTAMVHITLGTIDSSSLQEVILGFTVFPLFIDLKSSMPVLNVGPITKRELMRKPRTLHNGNYQMPIYCEYPPEGETLTYESYVSLQRLPTTSVCMRVDYASQDENGNVISQFDRNPQIASEAYYPALPYA